MLAVEAIIFELILRAENTKNNISLSKYKIDVTPLTQKRFKAKQHQTTQILVTFSTDQKAHDSQKNYGAIEKKMSQRAIVQDTRSPLKTVSLLSRNYQLPLILLKRSISTWSRQGFLRQNNVTLPSVTLGWFWRRHLMPA